MAAVAFNTLNFTRQLRDNAEMSQTQAEGVADALAEAMSYAELATRHDVSEAKAELKHEIAEVKVELKHEIADVRRDIRELELKIDGQFKEIAGQFKETNTRFEMVLERIDRRAAESDARMVRYVVGVGITVVLAIIGAIWAAVRFAPRLLS